MILITKDGHRYCNDGRLRDFAMFGNMPRCVKVYHLVWRAQAVAAKFGGQVVVIPPGMKVDAGGSVIETVPVESPKGFERHIRHRVEEFAVQVPAALGSR